jgi:hypothetical protein
MIQRRCPRSASILAATTALDVAEAPTVGEVFWQVPRRSRAAYCESAPHLDQPRRGYVSTRREGRSRANVKCTEVSATIEANI